MIVCDLITLVFTFEHESGDTKLHQAAFAVTSGLEGDVETYVEEWLEENDGYEYNDEYDITEYDDEFKDPADFRDLDEYADYVEKCVEHGEAYRLRYDDIGDFDFEDEYNGCWNNEEEFACQLFEDCYDIPDHLAHYIDWEKVARDLMMDYTSYLGDEGYHIFRDC